MVGTESLRATDAITIEVRRLLPGETPDALKLIHKSIRELTHRDYTSEQIERIVGSYHPSVLAGGIVVVAVHQSRLVGVAKTSTLPLLDGTIEAVFTHPEYVGRGIGRAMVLELERSAYRRKVKRLVVFSSMTAVGFYESLQFERDGVSKILGDVSVVIMHKQLMPSTLADQLSGLLYLMMIVGIFGLLYGFCWLALFLLL